MEGGKADESRTINTIDSTERRFEDIYSSFSELSNHPFLQNKLMPFFLCNRRSIENTFIIKNIFCVCRSVAFWWSDHYIRMYHILFFAPKKPGSIFQMLLAFFVLWAWPTRSKARKQQYTVSLDHPKLLCNAMSECACYRETDLLT